MIRVFFSDGSKGAYVWKNKSYKNLQSAALTFILQVLLLNLTATTNKAASNLFRLSNLAECH